jgi:hypothetical protein
VSRFRYAYNQLVYYGEHIATSIERVARYAGPADVDHRPEPKPSRA